MTVSLASEAMPLTTPGRRRAKFFWLRDQSWQHDRTYDRLREIRRASVRGATLDPLAAVRRSRKALARMRMAFQRARTSFQTRFT
jgi:hypothetical protein